MKTKCYSVRLQSLTSISEKAYKAVSFDGREDIIPKSQVFERDWEVQKSEAYWISAWILEKKSLQYSRKKTAWYNAKTRQIEPHFEYKVEKHIPQRKQPIKSSINNDLKR